MSKPLVLAATLALAACGIGGGGAQVIDGSSPEAFEQSLADARRELGPADRLKFEAALTEFRAQMFAQADNRQEYQRLVREGMNGLTAPAIVAQFDLGAAKVKEDAADAIFDAKRRLTQGDAAKVQ